MTDGTSPSLRSPGASLSARHRHFTTMLGRKGLKSDVELDPANLAQNNVKICSGAIVCTEQTTLSGDITISSKTVIHPTATIIAKNGPIVIGECNLIEEHVKIINNEPETMVIGSHNVFEVGSYTESMRIGDHNVLESKCYVGRKTLLGTGCIIGAHCHVDSDELLQENVVIYGSDCKRRIQSEKPTPQTFQLDVLSKIMPNYQSVEKPNFKSTPVSPTNSN